MSEALGIHEIRQLQADGWRIADCGTRVGNGWFVRAEKPDGSPSFLLLADPEDEPQKFRDDELPCPSRDQMDLELEDFR